MPDLVSTPPILSAELLSPQTTVGVIWRRAEQSRQRPMLHFSSGKDWESLSWAEAQRDIVRIAGALLQHGVEPGERVVIMAPNQPEWILSDFAIQLIGGITVPIYPTLTPANACEIARDCGARLAIVSSALQSALRDARLNMLTIEAEVRRWMEVAAIPAVEANVIERAMSLQGGDVATVIYTSGTTGTPKGVVLTHDGITTMAAIGAQAFELASDDVLLSFLPYSHVFERVEGIMAPLSVGATVWISRGAQYLTTDMQEAKPTLMLVVPRVLEKMVTAIQDGVRKRGFAARVIFRMSRAAGQRAKLNDRGLISRIAYRLAERYALEPLRTKVTGGRLRFVVSGGAPLRPDVEQFFWSIGLLVYQGWGLTETTAAAAANRPGAVRHGSVGRALANVQVRVEADGELLVKGPGVMREYQGQPQATAEVLVDGWLKTGDIGTIDAEGYITITDRKKDLIKTSTGKYVAPQPLETELQSFRYIAAAVLIGDQRPYIAALIQPAWEEVRQELKLDGPPDVLASDKRVQDMMQRAIESINRRLASFEAIKRFRIIAGELSEANGALTPSLKVRRRLVQQRYQQLIDEMYGGLSAQPSA